MLSKQLGLGSSTRAWWALNDNLWWSSRRVLAKSDFQHVDEVRLYLLFFHFTCIDFKHEVLEHLLNSKNVKVVLLMNVSDSSLKVLTLEIWILFK